MAKTILYFDHTAEMSGGEIALFQLVTALDRTRFTPVVVVASDGPLVKRLCAADIETHVHPMDKSITEVRKDSLSGGSLLRLRQGWLCVAYAYRLAQFARYRGAALIHTNSLKADLIGGLAGHLARLPVLWHVRDNIDNQYLPGLAAVLFRALADIVPKVVVTNSCSTLRRLRLRPDKKCAVVYSGCAVEEFSAPGEEAGTGTSPTPTEEGPIIGLFGRIAQWKGQHVLLEAVPRVLARFPKAQFWIVGAPLFGEDAYLTQLRAQAEESGISGHIHFLGFRSDIPALMRQVTVVAHTSVLDEPFGQVVVQAMAAGKPVVASNGGALPEIVVPGKTGLLIPPGDAEALADALCQMADTPEWAHALGAAGQQRVHQRFTLRQSAAKIQAVYDSVLPPTRPTPARPIPPENLRPAQV